MIPKNIESMSARDIIDGIISRKTVLRGYGSGFFGPRDEQVMRFEQEAQEEMGILYQEIDRRDRIYQDNKQG